MPLDFSILPEPLELPSAGREAFSDGAVGDFEVMEDPRADANPQFRISQSANGDITVDAGYGVETTLEADSAGNLVSGTAPLFVASYSFTPANSTDYGIWVKGTNNAASANSTINHRGGSLGYVQIETAGAPEIVHSDTYDDATAADVTGICGSTTDAPYVYLGRVVTDASGDATIEQDVFGPVYFPAVTYISDFMSSAVNALLEISARKLAVKDIVSSTGVLHRTTTGTVELQIASAGDPGIVVVDDTAGTVTIENTGVLRIIDSSATLTVSGTIDEDPNFGGNVTLAG